MRPRNALTLQAFIDARAAWQAQLAVHQQQLALENARMLGARDSLALEDLTAQGLIFSTDCSALMLMEHRGTEEIYTVWLTSVADVVNKGRQALLLRARTIIRIMEPFFFVPGVLKTFQNCRAMAWRRATCNMRTSAPPHMGLSSRTIVVTEAGHMQLVDLRFARKDNDGRCFTLCGDPEYLAPEMVESRSHTAAVDLWALGVLIYCLLSGTTPFAAPGDDELDVYRKLCARSLSWPPHFSPSARSLIDSLLQLQPSSRLGSGPGSFAMLKQHPWFAPVDWDALMQLRLPPPPGMLQRIDDFEGVAYARFEPPPYDGDLSWLEDF
ncbi:kinase-like domain-containing protein [Dunaliella salina]|uniref:Kinase-like domain-containing protein n=2 Tax=Dunaliella salina TaxID=3046 RepID=A0ABQ7GQW2_DUNSA|nr:kinase-like domain-containing protein [Dunaliella salina]|eukprot:KAF5836997.1 kinase-like domain-containing protein [Dunaliella salina]